MVYTFDMKTKRKSARKVPKQPIKLRKRAKGMNRITSANTIALVERRRNVMALKRAGWDYEDIGNALDLRPETIKEIVVDSLNRSINEFALNTEQERAIQMAQLDELMKINLPAATTEQKKIVIDAVTNQQMVITTPPDPIFTNVALKIMERRSKLLALDQPETKKVEVSGIREYKGIDLDRV